MYKHILNLIRKIQKQTRCPICNRKFDINEIKVKYILDEIAILHLNCNKGHENVQSVHVVILDKNPKPKAIHKNNNYISIDNKKIIDKQINEFDGDFIKLWKK